MPATILTSYYKPKPGGLCKRYFRAIQALLDRGHTVHYLSCEAFPIDHPNCIFHKFRWPIENNESLAFWCAFYMLSPIYLLCISVRHKPSHAFSFHPSYGLLLKLGTLFQKIKHTVFFRADSIENHKFKEKPTWIILIDSLIEGLAIRNSNLVFISRACQNGVMARHPSIKTKSQNVLYNDIRSSNKTSPNRKTEQVQLASVGILEPRKNQSMIIKALSAVKHTNYTYNIYGVGPDKNLLTCLIKQHKLENRVKLHGWKPRNEIWKNTDLLLLPSLHEGVSNALLEAIERNIPALASNIPEHKEVLQAESLVDLDDDSWARKTSEILTEPCRLLTALAESQEDNTQHLRFNWAEKTAALILATPTNEPQRAQ